MGTVTGLTFGGQTWIPEFLKKINWDTCLGCGRCFKVCGRGVMSLVALNDEGQVVDEDDDDDEVERKVMSVFNAAACIGCQACDRVCPKACHVYEPLPA